MGLIAYIYKNGGHTASNGGLSADHDEVTIVNVPGPFDPTEKRPPVIVAAGAFRGIAIVVPASADESGQGGWVAKRDPGRVGPMMGGCYVATSDSRFGDAVEKIVGARFYGAVALHDRFETPEEYATYSN